MIAAIALASALVTMFVLFAVVWLEARFGGQVERFACGFEILSKRCDALAEDVTGLTVALESIQPTVPAMVPIIYGPRQR